MIEVLIIDYILRRIENNLSLSDPGGFYDYITYLRTRIEYDCRCKRAENIYLQISNITGMLNTEID